MGRPVGGLLYKWGVRMAQSVDVSLTTIKARIGSVHLTLAAILGQSLPPARVILHVSAEPHLLDDGIGDLPADLLALQHSDPRLEVRYVPNTGPYRKILPWLTANRGSGRLVATADDDTIYPADWLARLVAARAAVGGVAAWTAHPIALKRGRVASYGKWFRPVDGTYSPMLMLPIGKDGVLYAESDFPDDVLDVETALRLAPTGDDLWLRWHLARRGVPVTVVGQGQALPETKGGPSLWRAYNRAGGNDTVVATLEDHFRATYGFTMASLS
jgi:hypothetical protein